MAKLAPTSTKYIIKAYISANGVIEKPDVIGAIFGQTEGLLGSDLDLRELQRTGRIGRIEVTIKSENGKSEGEIIIPSSLDSSETALIAATLETIERIGPCTSEIKLLKVEDTREDKRQYVVNKAQEILKGLMSSGNSSSDEISEQVKESVRIHEITEYHGLPCGPYTVESDEILIVEGRADVLNLLKYGFMNAIAIQGTSIPDAIVDLAKQKNVTLFVDGDRGGKLIAKELMQKTDVDFIASAPEGKEVEELTKKEISKAIRDKIPASQFKLTGSFSKGGMDKKADKPERRYERRPERRFERNDRDRHPHQKKYPLKSKDKELFKKTLEDLVGSRAAYIFDQDNQILGKVPVGELLNTIKIVDNPYAIIMDGKVDYDICLSAKRKGVKFVVGMDKDDLHFAPMNVLSKKDVE
ncbi:MAG: DNA primase DnaG [Candidatus Aenigmatarchaeota archaeon]|nr:DNA primase [Nanoarchaeota archaeon]